MNTRRSPYKPDFPGLENRAYLNTGAEGIPPKRCHAALEQYLSAKSRGAEGRPDLYALETACKQRIGQLLSTSAESIAFLGNASECINRLCNAIDWKPGHDEVIIDDLEFPSNVLPWLNLKRKGVEVKVLKSRSWFLTPEDFSAAISSRTRLVSVSHVSYSSGARLDIAEIAKIAHSRGAVFCVDATQSLGRIPVPLEGVDYLVASTYKWLLAPHGGGVLYCSPTLLPKLQPAAAGWWSVRDLFSEERFRTVDFKPTSARFELGMPNFLTLYGLNDSAAYLQEVGVAKIAGDLEPVCDFLIEELSRLPVSLMTPRQPERRAGLISFENANCEEIARRLAAERVHVWGGDGRVRISVHLYNDLTDAEQFIGSLRRILQKKPG